MAPAQQRPQHRLKLLSLAITGLLTWFLATSGGSGSGNSGGGIAAEQAECPLEYRRLSVKDIQGGQKPYLLGGAQQPTCTNCARSDGWATVCQFKSGQLCSDWVQQGIINNWVERGYELALGLTPCDLWPLIQGRTLFLMGDSMMLDFYKSTQCFLYEFWPELEQHNVTRDAPLQEELSKELLAACAVMVQHTRICYIRVDKGQDFYGRVLPLMPQVSSPSDLLVANFGLHHWQDYGEKLRAFTKYYRSHKKRLPRLLWQQTSQQHFDNGEGNGEYPGGKLPFQCKRIDNFTVVGDGVVQLEAGKTDKNAVLTGSWRNTEADPIIRKAGIPIVPSFNETLWMADMHRDNGQGHECTHFCHPSAPQTWVVALYRALRDSTS